MEAAVRDIPQVSFIYREHPALPCAPHVDGALVLASQEKAREPKTAALSAAPALPSPVGLHLPPDVARPERDQEATADLTSNQRQPVSSHSSTSMVIIFP